MTHNCIFKNQVIAAQVDVFRIACDPRRYDLTLRRISDSSGVSYSAIRNYAGAKGEPCAMGLDVLWKLKGVLPDELLNRLAPPGLVFLTEEAIGEDDRRSRVIERTKRSCA